MQNTLEGVETTLQRVLEDHEIGVEDLEITMRGLEESFNLLSQKWTLQMLFLLFLRNTMGFSNLKKILGVNSRTLSDKLKSLTQYEYLKRSVKEGPPLRVKYSLTTRGRNTILLALPLLYYSSSNLSENTTR
ncbi:MAG: winged helix-turn-helix transcriptional regulator [Candidatus Bathyarchaeota archaeon]|nr:winged helix-turn-helix transcriptional regulator [Candidatus Bathyarchaeota archaeon]